MDVCSDVINNKEIKLCIKFSDICVTEPDCEETEVPGPCQVPPVIPVNSRGKRIILYRRGKITNNEKDVDEIMWRDIVSSGEISLADKHISDTVGNTGQDTEQREGTKI